MVRQIKDTIGTTDTYVSLKNIKKHFWKAVILKVGH